MLTYSGQVSADGYLNDASGSFDFAMPSAQIHAFINDLERGTELRLMGRRMYDVMRYWDAHERGDGDAMDDFAGIWADSDKIVLSRGEPVVGPRTRVEQGLANVPALVDGRTASIGGAEVGGQALAAGLVDELWRIEYPVIVGGGSRWLPDGIRLDLELLDERRFDNGAVYTRWAVTA